MEPSNSSEENNNELRYRNTIKINNFMFIVGSLDRRYAFCSGDRNQTQESFGSGLSLDSSRNDLVVLDS